MHEGSTRDSRPLYSEYGKTCFEFRLRSLLILLVTFFPLVYPEFDICRQILFLESRLEFHLNDGIGWSTAVFSPQFVFRLSSVVILRPTSVKTGSK